MLHVRRALLPLLLAACGGGSSLLPDGGQPDAGGAVLPDGGATSCDAVPAADGLTLHVDPVAGDDALATGSATAGGAPRPACAFRSLTAALAVAAGAGRTPMHLVVDVSGTLGAGEAFPLVLPAGTSLAAAAGATVTVQVPTGVGVQLSSPGASLQRLVLDGQGAATEGVVASAAALTLSAVEVRGFSGAGLRAEKAAVVVVTGASAFHHDGVGVLAVDTAAVTLDAAEATLLAPLRVSANAGAGVQVRGAARVDAAGTVSTLDLGQGTLVLADNGGAGLSLQQLLVAEGSAGPPASTWSGVVVRASGGSGLELVAGSALKLRRSSLWANARHGVHLTTNPGFVPGGAGANTGNQLTRLDLGAVGDPGRNLLQDATHPNALKGVCLELSAGGSTGGLLPVAGNVFATGGSSVDCAQLAGSLPATGDCLAAGPLGDVGRNPKNDFDLGLCTVP